MISSNSAAYSRCSPLLTPLAYFLGQRLVIPWYFESVQISGQHHLPQTGPTIIAPTHRARWDSILLPLAVGRPASGRDLRFMVTADEVAGVQGWLIQRLGGFAVNIRQPSIASLRHGIDLLRAGEMLVIYPEGGIYRQDLLQPLKPGLARLAIQAEAAAPELGIQVLPVDIYYGETYPSWRSSMQVNIGEAIPVREYLHGKAAPDALKASARALTLALKTRLTRMIDNRKQGMVASPSASL
ncbi:MAG: 1-acyl-sn-glycerol-3-phosphate acyltransferase [Cyanobacteria bacterium REEB459]|nr:1-acyl-sn-glycerol-3-phosphate acyltransferase [Cyanobacteria bacterium REEB459]